MSELDQIQKEAKIEAIFNKLLSFYQQYQKLVILSAILIFITIIAIFSHAIYVKDINQKNVAKLQKLFVNEVYEISELKQLIDQNHSYGLKFISSMQYAQNLIQEQKITEAIDIYLDIFNDKNHDQFFREYSALIAVKYLTNIDDKKYDFIKIINNIENNSQYLGDYIKEQKAIYLWKNNNHAESKQIFQNLILDIKSSDKIKNRAKIMLEVAFNE
jgi:hypothetical protein